MALPLLVQKIQQIDNTHFSITWTNNETQTWLIANLRRNCPCALCVDEHTGELKLDPKTIPDDLRAFEIQSVGRYALTIHFGDGHQTGIFPFELLQKLAEK